MCECARARNSALLLADVQITCMVGKKKKKKLEKNRHYIYYYVLCARVSVCAEYNSYYEGDARRFHCDANVLIIIIIIII